MNKTTRNLIFPAAALAALLLAPASEARDADRGNGHDARSHERYERNEHGRTWVRPAPRYRYVAPYRAPYRMASGFRFYSVRPGPRYIYVAGFGWALPPYFGAVWIPGHYAFGGAWVDGCWR